MSAINILSFQTTEPTEKNYGPEIYDNDILANAIAGDIINDICDNAVDIAVDIADKEDLERLLEIKKSALEEIQQVYANEPTIIKKEHIEITKNYREELSAILQKLKCRTMTSTPPNSNNASLEEQIKKIIEEIKSLETTIRVNIEKDGHGDGSSEISSTVVEDSTEDVKEGSIEHKSGATDFFQDDEMKPEPHILDDFIDETVIQVIDLENEDPNSTFCCSNLLVDHIPLPPDDELKEIELNKNASGCSGSSTTEKCELGDRKVRSDVGDVALENAVCEAELSDKQKDNEQKEEKKKKSLGGRLLQFFSKNSSSSTIRTLLNKKRRNEK